MAKKEASADKLVKKVNKEIEKTSEKIESLISEALVQFDNIQGQLQEPIKKWITEIEDLREREVKRFGDELEKRLNDLRQLQHMLMDRLGFGAGSEGESLAREMDETAHSDMNPAKSKAKKAALSAKEAASTIAGAVNPATSKPKKSASKKSTAKQAAVSAKEAADTIADSVTPAGSKPKKTASKKSSAKKAQAQKPAQAKPSGSSRSAASKKAASALTDVKGIGPAMAEKLKAAGITDVKQLTNPSSSDLEKLKSFGEKTVEKWAAEAKKLA